MAVSDDDEEIKLPVKAAKREQEQLALASVIASRPFVP